MVRMSFFSTIFLVAAAMKDCGRVQLMPATDGCARFADHMYTFAANLGRIDIVDGGDLGAFPTGDGWSLGIGGAITTDFRPPD